MGASQSIRNRTNTTGYELFYSNADSFTKLKNEYKMCEYINDSNKSLNTNLAELKNKFINLQDKALSNYNTINDKDYTYSWWTLIKIQLDEASKSISDTNSTCSTLGDLISKWKEDLKNAEDTSSNKSELENYLEELKNKFDNEGCKDPLDDTGDNEESAKKYIYHWEKIKLSSDINEKKNYYDAIYTWLTLYLSNLYIRNINNKISNFLETDAYENFITFIIGIETSKFIEDDSYDVSQLPSAQTTPSEQTTKPLNSYKEKLDYLKDANNDINLYISKLEENIGQISNDPGCDTKISNFIKPKIEDANNALKNIQTTFESLQKVINTKFDNMNKSTSQINQTLVANKNIFDNLSSDTDNMQKLVATRDRMLQLSQERNVYKQKVLYILIAFLVALCIGIIFAYTSFSKKK